MRIRSPSPSPVFQPDATLPPPLRTAGWRLAPLHPDLAALDHAAWRSCRERLVAELRWNGWPGPDFSAEDNVADLHRHFGEFERREAYAYSVLADPVLGDSAVGVGACLGCVYIEPWRDGAQLAFWVVDAALPIEGQIVAGVLDWLAVWPIERVVLPLHPENQRGQRLLASLGLGRCPGPEGHVTFTRVGDGTPD